MPENELKGLTVAIVGGDLRMLEHMRGARAAGAMVQHYGSVPGAEQAAGRPEAKSLKEAVKGATIISCPIPGVGTDGSLFAKYTNEKLLMTPDVLREAALGALMFTYCDTPQLIEWAKGTPVEVIGYGEDDALSILHAIPTAEGAIKLAIEHTDVTLLGAPVLCFGLGRIGTSVAQAFDAMKARVTLTARNPAQLARAEAMGLQIVPLQELLADRDRVQGIHAAGVVELRPGGEPRYHRVHSARRRDHGFVLAAGQRRFRCCQGPQPQGRVGTRPGRYRAAQRWSARMASSDALRA